MQSKKSKYKQSLFDVSSENFGTLDNLITLSNDNNISLSKYLKTNTELLIDNENLGDADIKKQIIDDSLTFNNDYEALIFITVDSTIITVDSTIITADTR